MGIGKDPVYTVTALDKGQAPPPVKHAKTKLGRSYQRFESRLPKRALKPLNIFKTFCKFIGPGIMVSIAYMDPGNYSTAVSGGAQKQYKMLFVTLLSTIIALYLQCLSIKLGTVTGKDLARNCKDHLPKWMGYILYIFAESAIIATDIAEIIGTAIALDILLHIPVIAGVCLTMVDVMVVLCLYRPGKSLRIVRVMEALITILLLAIVVCFCVMLGKIPRENVGKVLFGFVPSRDLITGQGVQLASGILGATCMPHSLYLGSAMAIPRLLDYDEKHDYKRPDHELELDGEYVPSADSIDHTKRYAYAELIFALCTFAIFVNAAILIVAGDVLYGTKEAEDADLYSLYDILNNFLSKGAAITFFIALLCSGQSAGIICTIAGQIVSEGHLNWRCRPWVRRIITRLIAIIPCIIIGASIGKRGLSDAINWSQIVLTITLPFLASPLVYLTSRNHIMTVTVMSYKEDPMDTGHQTKCYANSWFTAAVGAVICLFIGIVNVYVLVNVGITGAV